MESAAHEYSKSESPKHGAQHFPFMDLPPALILEVFKHLEARELSVVACTCRVFRVLASDNRGWKDFYCERWGSPAAQQQQDKSWRDLYVEREARCKAFLGNCTMDRLVGHTDTVRALRMLPSCGIAVSGGLDSCVRVWDLQGGIPLACSPPLGETIRALAVNSEMLAIGGSSAVVRLWRAEDCCSHLFDVVCGDRSALRGHTGPVSCLGLDGENVYSGSWDMTIRAWRRSEEVETARLAHWDWVWALVSRGHRLLSVAGSDGYTWDIETGKLLRFREKVHEGKALAVEGNRSGNHIVTGGEDGAVRLFDNRIPGDEPIAAWIPHMSAVNALAFDDPWLVSGSADGALAMMDLRHLVRRGNSNSMLGKMKGVHIVKGDTVQRMLGGGGQPVYAVDIGGDRIASAGKEAAIRVWDFSRAIEAQRRAQASRDVRAKQRMLRKQKNAASSLHFT